MYFPTEEDKEWAQNLMRCQTNGTLAVFPSAKLIYRKLPNQLILVCGNPSHPCHVRAVDVFDAIDVEVSVKIHPRGEIMAELLQQIRSKATAMDIAGLSYLEELTNSYRYN